MATITTTITQGITLAASGTYASPLTITSTGAVDAGTGYAVYGPATQAWTVNNQGTIAATAEEAIRLADGGAIINSGSILSPAAAYTVYITGGAGFLTNSLSGYIGIGGIDFTAGGTVVNAGRIVDTNGPGIRFGGAGTVTNSGTITGSGFGISLAAGGTVVDSGTVSGGNGTAISFGGTVANRLVLDPGYDLGGVVGGSTAAGATNTLELGSAMGAGTVSAALATEFVHFGTVTVDAGAQWTLTGTSSLAGITLTDLGSLTNTGSLSATVTVTAGGYLNNGTTGTIGTTAGAIAVYVAGASTTVVNSGTMLSSAPGVTVSFLGVGSLTNSQSGYIGSHGVGFYAGGSAVNNGRIVGLGFGVVIAGAAGAVTNSGTILGSAKGVFVLEGGNVANNAGLIEGANGVYFDAAGTVTNSGTILGSITGVVLFTGGTVVDSGTISGTAGPAISFGGTGANRLVLDPGYQLGGIVVGGTSAGATNTLELASAAGAGTVSASLPFEFVHFGTATVDAGAQWTLTGTSSLAGITLTDLGSLTNTGSLSATVTVAGGGYLDNAGTIGTTAGEAAVVGVAGGGTIVNSGTMLSNGTATFTVGGMGLSLTNSQSGYIGTGGMIIGGTVVNAGRIVDIFGPGIELDAAGVITNTGTIAAVGATNTGQGILAVAGASIANNGGLITGASGIYVTGTAGTVSNSGTITGTATGTTGFGISLKGGGTVVDSGTVSGAGGTAVYFGGTAANRLVLDPGYQLGGVVVGGTSAGATNTLELASVAGVGTLSAALATEFVNFGAVTIDPGAQWALTGSNTIGAGVTLSNLGTLTELGTLTVLGTLANAGAIGGGGELIVDPASLFNSGSITLAATLSGGGYFDNEAGGAISVVGIAVYGTLAAATIVNAGTILSTATGIVLNAGGSVVDSGSIGGGGGTAISFGGAGSNRLTLDPGYHLGGVVAGSTAGASNTLELGSAAGAGTVSGLGTEFVNFGAVAVDAGAQWSLTGSNTVGAGVTLGNLGTLTDLGTLANAGSIGGSGELIVDPASLFNSGSIGVSVTLSGGGTLDNEVGGAIAAVGNAVYGALGAATIVNTGTIVGTGTGITLNAGGTVIDAGSISGAGGRAVSFGGTGSNLLVLEHGYQFNGNVVGSASATNTVELAGSVGAAVTAFYDRIGLTDPQEGYFQDLMFGAGGNNTLTVSNNGTLAVTVSGFTLTSDIIDLTGIGTDGTITNQSATEVTVTGSEGTVTLLLDASDSSIFGVASDGVAGIELIACYRRGTLIGTAAGEVAVEELAIGDRVVTVSGMARPIKWLGHRAYDSRFVAGNRAVLPIRIEAGALADGIPARDLFVSPEHALYLDDRLVPARLLANGVTIRQVESVERLDYFHIELDTHDAILAEGAAAETFADCDNRGMFHNAGEFASLYPGDRRPAWDFCALRLEEGSAELPTIRAALLARAEALGRVTSDPDLHLIADGGIGGEIVRAQSVAGCVHRFAIPAGSCTVWLASRSIVPAEIETPAGDLRRLGVAVERITLSDSDLTISAWHSHAGLCDGFHGDEDGHRWTDGLARLPEAWLRSFPGGATLDVYLASTELRYRSPSPILIAATA